MDPLQTLMNEHRLIETALSALWNYAGQLGTPASDPADLGKFVDFIRGFADAHHHGKEEDLLFTEMVAAGFPREMGPIGVMLAEHDEGRRQVAILAEEAALAGRWTEANHERIAGAARAYVSLLQQHISKEDNILYPMAMTHLPPEALQRLAAAVEAFEDRKQADRSRFRSLAEELTGRYAQFADRVAPPPTACSFCCGEAVSSPCD